ncbi:16S rRNA pseudouridine(516) synthase, partial [Staphylococcus pseudintermedius]|nr:16S rRNA pseudouridine(516) synthase [Staphylococcus pseudintermedius]
AFVTIQEGKYHQVKRMFHAIDNEVVGLKRVSIGDLTLDSSLSPGAYRSLTEDELKLLNYR